VITKNYLRNGYTHGQIFCEKKKIGSSVSLSLLKPKTSFKILSKQEKSKLPCLFFYVAVKINLALCMKYMISCRKMAENSDCEEALRDPYRDDPTWQDWHAHAVDVQGGPDDSSSEDDDDESGGPNGTILPETCVCLQCRSFYLCYISRGFSCSFG
jgi:hypothetical protein